MSKTVCFTGRRPKDLCGYNRSSYEPFKIQLIEYLETLYTNGFDTFISGGAQGFDQLAFWCVAELKKKHSDVKNIVYIPFKTQPKRWKEYGLFSKQEYYAMLNSADEVYNVSSVDVPADYGKCVKFLMKRNEAMVDKSNLCVALYPDDTWHTSTGGTASAMRYASDKSVEISQLKYHIDDGKLKIND